MRYAAGWGDTREPGSGYTGAPGTAADNSRIVHNSGDTGVNMASTKADNGDALGCIGTFPGRRCPAAALGKYTQVGSLIYCIALVGSGYPENHLLPLKGLPLREGPYLPVAFGQHPVQQRMDVMHAEED